MKTSKYKSWKGQDKKSIDYDAPCEKKIKMKSGKLLFCYFTAYHSSV